MLGDAPSPEPPAAFQAAFEEHLKREQEIVGMSYDDAPLTDRGRAPAPPLPLWGQTRPRRCVRQSDGAPLTVRDWVRGLIEGRDQLSDAGSALNASEPVFKSMGAWSVGPNGEVYLENTDGDFENIWIQPGGKLVELLRTEEAMARYTRHASQLRRLLA